MISRTRGIFSTILWKPKVIHSLEYLRYLYTVLLKNFNVTEQNTDLLVEVFRLIAEILIWGDQNDSSIMDFFLEKNILSLFLKFLNQENGKLIYKQLLQTLSIMFENISDTTSIYYLLSNNHINDIIYHKFDFNDEEVMAYYISFLKALSMKLNKHTINFFYDEQTEDFALLTESLKYFNHSESMVRTAVRNITLNVYKVVDRAMLNFVHDKTAMPYFHNLMWIIGNRVMEIDVSISRISESQNYCNSLQAIVEEHWDHLHYINDIISLDVKPLNDILVQCLLNRLHIPLYVFSLSTSDQFDCDDHQRPRLSSSVSMFLLVQVFLVIEHPRIVQFLATIILTRDLGMCADSRCDSSLQGDVVERKFEAPAFSLAQALDNIKSVTNLKFRENRPKTTDDSVKQSGTGLLKLFIGHVNEPTTNSAPVTPRHRTYSSNGIINETKATVTMDNYTNHHITLPCNSADCHQSSFNVENRKQFLTTILQALEFDEDSFTSDYDALFALSLLYAMSTNKGVNGDFLNSCGLTSKYEPKSDYSQQLMDHLITIFNISVKFGSTVRLVTLEMACKLAALLVCSPDQCWISDEHFAYILTAFEESKLLLRNYFKNEVIFVEMFEDEYLTIKNRPLNLELVMTDWTLLLPVGFSKISEFAKRLPTNDVERARYSIRVFLLLHDLCERFKVENDVSDNTDLSYPFNGNVVYIADELDLNCKEVIACTIEYNNKSEQRVMIVDEQQLILLDPDSKLHGYGIVTFVGLLQYIEVKEPQDDDDQSLLINVYNGINQSNNGSHNVKLSIPILAAKFTFHDRSSCLVALNRIVKGREMVHQLKLQQIALMLDFPPNVALSIKSEPFNNNKEYRSGYFGPKEFAPKSNNGKETVEISDVVPSQDDLEMSTTSRSQASLVPEAQEDTDSWIDKWHFL